MTIKAWLDIRTGTGEVVKNLKLLWESEKNILGAMLLENSKNYLKN